MVKKQIPDEIHEFVILLAIGIMLKGAYIMIFLI